MVKNYKYSLATFLCHFSLQILVPGESMNPAAMVALIDYREIDGEERPVMIASSEMSEFWQHIAWGLNLQYLTIIYIIADQQTTLHIREAVMREKCSFF